VRDDVEDPARSSEALRSVAASAELRNMDRRLASKAYYICKRDGTATGAGAYHQLVFNPRAALHGLRLTAK
jgi:hypothetical protein